MRKAVIEHLFHSLERNGIRAVLASHFENGTLEQGDIDLFVEEKSKTAFLKLLKDIGWLMRREPAEDSIHSFFYFLPENGDAPVSLDVKFRIEFRDASGNLLIAREPKMIFDQKIKNAQGQFRPRGKDALILYLFHIMFEKNKISDRHLDEFSDYLRRYKAEIITPEEIEDWNIINEFYESQLLQHDGIRAELSKDFVNRRFAQVSANRPRKRSSRCGFGYSVLFLGPDGAGKSTAIADLSDKFDIKTSLLYLGEKQWYFAAIGRLYHAHPGRLLRKFAIYFLYPFDLFCRIAQKKRDGEYRLFLIDRIPGFPMLGGSALRKVYQAVIPPIDLMIRFTGDLDTIWERKKEISKVELVDDDAKWGSVAETFPARTKIIIDTSVQNRSEVTRMIRMQLYSDTKFVERLFQPIVFEEMTTTIGFSKTRMQSFIFSLPRVVIKIPFSVGALREMKRERENLKKVALDKTFNKYVPSYRFIGPISITPRLFRIAHDDEKIQPFFADTMEIIQAQGPRITLAKALDYAPLKIFLDSLHEAGIFWIDYIHKTKVVSSSIHGDFHRENVLTDRHCLFFIDWTNYREHSCRVFDMIDFYTTDTALSWTKEIFSIYKEQLIEKKTGMHIEKETLANYCLWKTAKELRELTQYSALTPSKKEKYLTLLTQLQIVLKTP